MAASGLLSVPLGVVPATASDVNSLVVNQFNAVSGDKYLDNGQSDPQLSRLRRERPELAATADNENRSGQEHH